MQRINIKHKFPAILLIAIFLSYFTGTNMFYHTHIINDNIYSHSHPFDKSEHEHSTQTLIGIELLSNYSVEEINLIPFEEYTQFLLSNLCFADVSDKLCLDNHWQSFTIRPPPENSLS
ncbi:hypothetical protein LJC30_03105 [Odoribacter sp. OttesenSCG-928-L07]|nr:hypothetical protein [Odoribacter sp. OttesenSCG-928-L07]MDL2239100.1 hypothetical protein [Bacteroidales bacterium OttesenSCG-928-L14]MDL2240013.1 hypothetical protein [Bacteroidales bacterium OttesenSCG-928-K22]